MPIWDRLAEHAGSRTTRHKDDTNIEMSWILEAWNDPDHVDANPDYNSISGKSARRIGWSDGANHLVTIIVYTEEGRLYGASAWKSGARDENLYEQQHNV